MDASMQDSYVWIQKESEYESIPESMYETMHESVY